MTTLIAAEDVVQTTAYNALVNAIDIVVKAHTLIESINIAEENNIDGASIITTTTNDDNMFIDKQPKPNIVNEAKGNPKKKINGNQKTQQKSPIITLRMLKKVEASTNSSTHTKNQDVEPTNFSHQVCKCIDSA